MVDVIYSTEGFAHRNHGQPGTQVQRSFPSLEAAMAAPLPDGCVAACIKVAGGHHVYSRNWRWEFHPATAEEPVADVED